MTAPKLKAKREFTKKQWRKVAKRLRPDWTDQDFEREWSAFVEWKRKKTSQ